jgi:methylmalonyl-CoA mutase
LRNTSAAAAAIVGGASSITVTPHNFVNDQWINNESEVGVRIARNLPIILQEESLLASVEDPMAGSYAVEALTDELVDTVWESLKDMEKNGGWMHTLNSGQWSEALASSHRLRVESLKTKSSVRVGVNRFRADDSHPELRATSNPESPQVSSAQLVPVREAASFGA